MSNGSGLVADLVGGFFNEKTAEELENRVVVENGEVKIVTYTNKYDNEDGSFKGRKKGLRDPKPNERQGATQAAFTKMGF